MEAVRGKRREVKVAQKENAEVGGVKYPSPRRGVEGVKYLYERGRGRAGD